MIKRLYPVLVTALIVTVGLWASSSVSAQKEKEKEKAEKAEKELKNKLTVAGEYPSTFAYQAISGVGGYLGVYLEEVTSERMKELGLGEERGAVVMKVVQQQPRSKSRPQGE